MLISNKINAIVFILVALGLFTFSCSHSHSDEHGHSHGDEPTSETDEHEDEGKIVHLNQAQFLNTDIDTGWFVLKNISEVINANGYTKLDPDDEADISLPLRGTVKTIGIIEGEFVRKGQLLATITSLEYNNFLLERSKLTEELTVSESQLVFTQQEYDRQRQLSEKNINARKMLEQIAARLQSEKAKVETIRTQIGILETTINSIQTTSSETLAVMAPITGYVTDVFIKIGSVVNPGDVMISIVNNHEMHVDILVYEKDIQKVKVGQTVRFILANQSDREIKGEVYNIGKSFENDTKSIAVHADIENNDASLIPGMYVNALIDIGENLVNTLPSDAIVMAEGREYIFVWNSKHVNDHKGEEGEDEYEFYRIEVKTGARQLGHVEVIPLEEIHRSDRIVIQGSYYLQSHLLKMEGGGGHHH